MAVDNGDYGEEIKLEKKKAVERNKRSKAPFSGLDTKVEKEGDAHSRRRKSVFKNPLLASSDERSQRKHMYLHVAV